MSFASTITNTNNITRLSQQVLLILPIQNTNIQIVLTQDMKIHTACLIVFVFYTLTAGVNANALPVRRNVFSRRVFTSVGVSGAHRAFATKKESNQEVEVEEKKKNVTTAETSKTQDDISFLSTKCN